MCGQHNDISPSMEHRLHLGWRQQSIIVSVALVAIRQRMDIFCSHFRSPTPHIKKVDSPVAKPVIHDTMTEKPTDVKTLAEKFAFSDTVGVESTSAATSLAELAIDKSIAADPIVVNTYR